MTVDETAHSGLGGVRRRPPEYLGAALVVLAAVVVVAVIVIVGVPVLAACYKDAAACTSSPSITAIIVGVLSALIVGLLLFTYSELKRTQDEENRRLEAKDVELRADITRVMSESGEVIRGWRPVQDDLTRIRLRQEATDSDLLSLKQLWFDLSRQVLEIGKARQSTVKAPDPPAESAPRDASNPQAGKPKATARPVEDPPVQDSH